jgi:hypothetical protein
VIRRAASVLLVSALALLGSSPGVAETQVLYRASTSSSGIHGFYDHEGLLPVPLLNLSAPYTEATLEPGPATSSLGSFLWEPQAAELKTIMCVLSEGEFCQLPDYPFQATASHPSAGGEEDPPTVDIEHQQAPVRVRGAHDEAEASAKGARATATVASFEAIPMTPAQAKATGSLATALSGLEPLAAPEEPGPWLVTLRKGAGTSETEGSPGGARATSETELKEVELLGGLITARSVAGPASAAVGAGGGVQAKATIAGLKVGDFDAEIGPNGIRVEDHALGKAQAKAVNAALNGALSRIGVSVSRGSEEVKRSKDGVSAEAYAFSLDFERENLPDQAPEGTKGPDILHVPLGLATAEAEVAQIVAAGSAPPPPGGSAPAEPPALGGSAPARPPPLPKARAAASPASPGQVAAEPRAGFSNLGVPAVAVAMAVLMGLLAAAGLSWLKVNEVLTE